MDEFGGDRRLYRRVPVDCDAQVEFKGVALPVKIMDLSLNGAYLERENFEWPEVGTDMLVCLLLRAQEITLYARVTRHGEPTRRAAVHFESMSPECRSRMVVFVGEQERKLLKAHLHLRD
jgi:hypothetical protein